jgi:hypothetical protein
MRKGSKIHDMIENLSSNGCCHTSTMLLTIDYGKIKGRLQLEEN